jgi:hypothetical protein
MTSDAKIEANRLNAQKSTGPRTRRGKLHAKGNALRHGFFADRCVVHGESEEEFDLLLNNLIDTFGAEDPIALTYVTQIAGDIVRLKRVDLAERMNFNREFLRRKFSDVNKESPVPDELLALELFCKNLEDALACLKDEQVRQVRQHIVGSFRRNVDALVEWQRRRPFAAQHYSAKSDTATGLALPQRVEDREASPEADRRVDVARE